MPTKDRHVRKMTLRTRAIATLAVLALVFTACGGGGDDEQTATTSDRAAPTTATPGSGANPTTAPTGGDEEPQTVEFTTGEEVYHSGFRIDVLGGSIVPEVRGFSREVVYTLILELDVENLGSEPAFFGPSAAITSNTGSYVWDSGFSLADDVPGGLSDIFEIKLRVDEGFDPSSATFIIGDANENRAVAPLGPGGDTAVRLPPVELDVSGELNLELLDIVVSNADLRYDEVERHRQVEAGKRALTLHFDIVSRKNGNWSIFDSNFALAGPDGSAISADSAKLENIPGADGGVTTENLSVTFLVDEDASGDHVLRFAPGTWFVGDDGVTEGEFAFTLP